MPVNSKIQVRKGIASDWNSANPVLASGEPGYDTTNGGLKIGNGSLSWNQLNYIGVLGTGTTNFIAKFTANQNLGNSLIFDNGTNVGIGTAAPLAQLHVFNQTPSSSISEVARFGTSGTYDGNFRFLVGSTSDRGGELRYYEGNTEYSRVNFDVNRIDFITRGAYPINFLTNNNGSEGNNLRMTITSDGNVGIGTDTPSYKLNVNTSTDSSNGLQIVNNSAGTSARSLLSLNNGTYGAEISVGGAGFTNNGFYRQNRLLISGPFITDYVTSQHVFHIGGGGTGQSVSGSTQVGVWDINALAVYNELRPTGGIAGGTLVGSSLSLKSTTAVGTTDHIKLLVGNNGATEAVRVINNGNVGIGTTTPEYKLQVNGSVNINGEITAVIDGGGVT